VSLLPQSCPLMDSQLPRTEGRVGSEPEDFQVEEIPLFEPDGTGEHLFVHLRKRGWTTPDMIQAVAKIVGSKPRDVGSAGMKDKHAVTTQWISLLGCDTNPAEWCLPEGLQVLSHSRHSKKLRTGQLRGNHFKIRLEGVHEAALERASVLCVALRERGLPNYFGPQRFGHGGRNLETALHWLRSGKPLRGKKARLHTKLYPSVIQAEIFNRYLSLRRELGLEQLLEGEVVRLDGSNSVFLVSDPSREQPRLVSRDIHLTGPMVGPKARAAGAVAAELEVKATASLGLRTEELEFLGRHAAGTRRDLLVRPEGLDVHQSRPGSLDLCFSLPAGSYATRLIAEISGNDQPRRTDR